MKLDLRSPLLYEKIGNLPDEIHENDDFLLCYELNPSQSRSIEPDRGLFCDSLVFVGRKIDDSAANAAEIVSLPEGNYLFTQRRSAQVEKEWLDLAIDQQKDGLWERYRPETGLFIRFLFEDGGFVTQLFRVLPAKV